MRERERQTGHVTHMRMKRVLVWKPGVSRPLGKHRRWWKGNIKMVSGNGVLRCETVYPPIWAQGVVTHKIALRKYFCISLVYISYLKLNGTLTSVASYRCKRQCSYENRNKHSGFPNSLGISWLDEQLLASDEFCSMSYPDMSGPQVLICFVQWETQEESTAPPTRQLDAPPTDPA